MRWRAWLFALVAFCTGLGAPARAQLVDPGYVAQTILSSGWSPASPDPSGITYLPETGELLTCDSEVDEMSIYAGLNLWTHSSTGVVSATASTSGFSVEPSGIAADPAGGRLWISDDNTARIYEVDLGADGSFGTADDFVRDLDGLVGAGCDDFKDVTYDSENDRLFVVSRAGLEICEIVPGPNGIFDGAFPTGDDGVTTVSLVGSGITLPEGIVYDPASRVGGSLVVADKGTRDLYEFTPGGGLLRKIDVNFPGSVRPSGVTIAPGSANAALRNYYVTDRGQDNNVNPLENDGRVFEVVAIPLGGNGAPSVDAGLPQAIEWPANEVSLDGAVSDDGHPYPPSAVTITWSLSSGPGGVSFDNANSPGTTATFSAPGSYVLQLLADDSELSTTDAVSILVQQIFALSVSSVGPGSVTLDPPGGSYADGTPVTVTATPDPDAAFVGWSGDLSGSASPETLLVDAGKSITASFATLYDVGTSVTGPGSVELDPPGGTYPAGTIVSVSATPGAGAVFLGFGSDLAGTTTPQQLTVDADKSVSASFEQLYTLSVSASGPGSVALDPPGGTYAAGTSVTVTATPDPDAAFLGFAGDLGGTTNPQVVVLNVDTSATASFATLYDVGTSVTGPGSVELDPPGGMYPAGTIVSVSATPGAGAVFLGFGSDLAGTTTPQLLTVDGDKAVSASFSPESHTLSVTSVGSGTVTLDPPGGLYEPGTAVTLTAVPAGGYFFNGWSGDASGAANPLLVVVDADYTVSAAFNSAGGSGTSCGIGPELVALLPALGWLLRRRRETR